MRTTAGFALPCSLRPPTVYFSLRLFTLSVFPDIIHALFPHHIQQERASWHDISLSTKQSHESYIIRLRISHPLCHIKSIHISQTTLAQFALANRATWRTSLTGSPHASASIRCSLGEYGSR